MGRKAVPLPEAPLSLSVISTLLFNGDNRRTLDKAIRATPGLDPDADGKYDGWKVAQAVIRLYQSTTTTDRRNNAIAEKAETEAAILQKKFRPTVEMQEAVSTVGTVFIRAIEATELPGEVINDAVESVRGKVEEFVESLKES